MKRVWTIGFLILCVSPVSAETPREIGYLTDRCSAARDAYADLANYITDHNREIYLIKIKYDKDLATCKFITEWIDHTNVVVDVFKSCSRNSDAKFGTIDQAVNYLKAITIVIAAFWAAMPSSASEMKK